MPKIDTSSDMYQNRDPSLTTYKKDLDPAVAFKDVSRADQKQRVRELQQDVPKLKNQEISKNGQQRDMNKAALSKSLEPLRPESLYPPLYEPRRAPTDQPVDASSFITGGTVDVRA